MEAFMAVRLMAEVIGQRVDTPDHEVGWCSDSAALNSQQATHSGTRAPAAALSPAHAGGGG
jgi:hypothetical protein